LIGGVCITTIGPGGIFVTIALFVMLPLSPGTVAGTASSTFIVTGIAGSLGYLKSGELYDRAAFKAAIVLGLASVAGSYLGSEVNKLLDAASFAIVLGIFVLFIGFLILYRQRFELAPEKRLKIGSVHGLIWIVAVGLGVGFPGALLGLGGPVLAVPLLVVLGVPMLLSVALAQVQSVFISGMATVGYALQGTIDWGLAGLLVVPLLIGAISGWHLVQRIQVRRLKAALAVVLVALGVYLVIGGAPGM
ncbi:MAG TPA: sulfite exporter TauE/SafE family protein, partial [Balneolaceae bacterium]|nr:sulfite exporter TauE/SafE family protein [Balneolaceae bacterium]